MNDLFLYEAINEIDDNLITAANVRVIPKKKRNKGIWASAAAVLIVTLSVLTIENGTFDFSNTKNTTITGKNEVTKQQNNLVDNTSKESNFSNTKRIKLFEKTLSSPDLDDYGEDGLQYVDLIIDGIIYHQIDTDSYNKYGLKTELSENDFGEYIGIVQELTEENNYNNSLFKVSSHENSLDKAKAYYYVPTNCKAAVIVEKAENCSIFIADDFTDDTTENYYEKLFELFGIKNSSDIKSISCEIWKGNYDETNTAILEHSTITVPQEIESIYNILISNKKAESQEISITKIYNISMRFNLENGLTVGNDNYNFTYMPYNSTGYIDIKGVITAEQNEILKQIFNLE